MITAGGQINDGATKLTKKNRKSSLPRKMVVEDALDVAHGSLGGRDIHALIKRVAKQAKVIASRSSGRSS